MSFVAIYLMVMIAAMLGYIAGLRIGDDKGYARGLWKGTRIGLGARLNASDDEIEPHLKRWQG